MKRTRKRIDWADVKQRLRQSQHGLEEASLIDAARLDAVYRQRAAQLAARGTKAAVGRTMRVLVVAVGTERYGIELGLLSEVLPLANWIPVPGAPPELLGVINVRGELYSVMNIARLLKIAATSNPVAGYVVLVRHGKTLLGVHVDQVETVDEIARDALAPIHESEASPATPYLLGISPTKVIVLDIETLFSQAGL